MKKSFLTFAILIICFLNMGSGVELNDFKIDAAKNAELHNNIGVNYLKEKYYYGAIKEFEMAISLNPKTQATSVYYDNLGKTYIIIGYSNRAKICYERALVQSPLNFQYYLSLSDIYKRLNMVDVKLKEYKYKTANPLDKIMLGLLYIEKGDKATGITILDNFCNEEPDLIITKAIKNYIKQFSKNRK